MNNCCVCTFWQILGSRGYSTVCLTFLAESPSIFFMSVEGERSSRPHSHCCSCYVEMYLNINRKFITETDCYTLIDRQQNLFFTFSVLDKRLCPTEVGQLFPKVKNAGPIFQLNQVLHAVDTLLRRLVVLRFPKFGQQVCCARKGLGHGRVCWEKPSVPQGG